MGVNRQERILAAAHDLIVRQGFRKTSMSQVAAAARVAKGTAYSYWPSKEALFVRLIADTFRETLGEAVAAIRADPAKAAPGPLLLALLEAAFRQGLIRALQDRDETVLGDLLDNPESARLAQEHSAIALLRELLPVWRHYGAAAREDSAGDQLGELELLALGYFLARERRETGLGPKRLDHVLQAAVARVLGTPETRPAAGQPPANGTDPAELAAASAAVLERHIRALADPQED